MKLAQKYRPGKFRDVIGQNAAVDVLKAIVTKRAYGSAYLLSGPSGVGKTTLGRIFAKASLCESPVDGDPCGSCESCRLFENEQHFGYLELDSASVGGKDDMVKLRDEASFLSASKKKIILLDECHDISKQGQDALLEQVESCPDHLIYIFCTTDPEKMKPALRNRCMQFQFTKVSPELIVQRLKHACEEEMLKYDMQALEILAERSEGHVRNALNLLEEVSYFGEISSEHINRISKDFDAEFFTILSNIGLDLSKVIEASRTITSFLSASEFYNQLIAMASDAAKFLYGYENFSAKRKQLLATLKDIHGHSLLEFLNYLISRDKFVDKVGLSSDLVILHYKFSSQNFIPKVQKESPINTSVSTKVIPSQTQSVPTAPPPTASTPILTYTELRKLSEVERGRVLSAMRRNQKPEQKEESENVPANWPLPKENRVGESSLDEIMLSPQEFSQNLVGGRSGGSSMVHIGT